MSKAGHTFHQTTEHESNRRIRRSAARNHINNGNGGAYLIRLILFTSLILLFITIKQCNP